YLSVENQKGKEKERDIIDEIYQMVIERKEKLRKIKEIKSFFNELSSLSSSAQPVIITSLGQAPNILPIIPPVVTTTPSQQTSQSAQSSQEQEQKRHNTNQLTAFGNLFNISTLMPQDLQRRVRAVEEGKDSIIIPQGPSLHPHIMTTISDDNKNNSKKREANRITENTKQEKELGEDRHYIVGQPVSKLNLLMGNPDDGDIYSDRYDWDGDGDFYSPGREWRIKRDSQGNIIEARKIITDPIIHAKHVILNKQEKLQKIRTK
ncbi:MAG: hypothetical protein M3250_07035, partial [Thermoproteota archaeon]|nr:hypothetical protein [Thermoproteota archaeon]